MSTKVSKSHITVFSRLFSFRWPGNLRLGGFCFPFCMRSQLGTTYGVVAPSVTDGAPN